MMNNRELRIGNLITYESDIVEVSGISRSGCIDYNKNGYDYGGWTSNEYQPIQITEEWLLKFGFEIGYNKTKMLDVYCKDFGILIERSNGGNFYYKKICISSVHQLQNIYFALTNEELTYEQ